MEVASMDRTNPETWPAIMTLRDIQAVSPFGRNKLLEMANAGEIPVRRIRGRWVINRDIFLEWLKTA